MKDFLRSVVVKF